MDGATAHRLANEMAGVLNVSATEGIASQFKARVPSMVSDASVSQGGGFATYAAADPKPASTAPASVHRADGPQPGDVLLKETTASTFELQRVTRTGFERWKDVPPGGLIDAVMFAHANVGDRNLWLEKLVDAGQPTLVPRLSQSSESA
jgi:hypothetical protein